MQKNDDIHKLIELASRNTHDDELYARIQKIENEKAIKDGINKWIRVVCISGTTSFLGFCSWLGSFIYDNFKAVEIGVKAFIVALRGGQ